MGDLILKHVTKRFGSVTAVSDVNLEIPDGEYWVFLGPSGCGKTTTLRMIGGHEHPTEGEIRLDGVLLNGVPAANRDVITVFQHFALFPHKTVRENVEFGLKMKGVSPAERERKAREALELVGLSQMSNRKPDELSSGQKQRVALARALVMEPKVLLLDEPFGDLDRLLQIHMRAEMRRIQRRLKRTFIQVTHNQEEALSLADKIVVMKDGKVQQVGTPLELYTKPANEFVASFMGENNLIPATVEEVKGEYVVLKGDGGTVLMAKVDSGASRGLSGSLCVRASRTRILPAQDVADHPVENSFPCSVSFVEYLGDTVKLHLQHPGGQEMLVRMDDETFLSRPFSEGEQVVLTWRAEDARFLPKTD